MLSESSTIFTANCITPTEIATGIEILRFPPVTIWLNPPTVVPDMKALLSAESSFRWEIINFFQKGLATVFGLSSGGIQKA